MHKILHIPNYYPPHIGGIEDVCYNVVSNVKGFQHKVICFNDRPETQADLYEGVEVVRCGVWKKLFSQSVSFSFLKELKRLFRDYDPDIVHFHTPNPLSSVYLLLALPEKVKLIIHWHSDIIEQKTLYRFYYPIERKLLERSSKIFITSPTYLGGSRALMPFEGKIEVIPNTINSNKLDKRVGDEESIRQIESRYENKKIIFTFGRHVSYKGLEYLIKAAPLISDDAVVVIAGKGPLTERLKGMPESAKIEFVGRISDDDLRYYLHAAYLFAFPSITRNEAFGVALAEAMYCELPAVTFTIPDSGVNWLCLHNETGLESPNRDYRALADSINRLLADDSLRRKLGRNAKQRILDNFTNEVIKENLLSAYSTILSR